MEVPFKVRWIRFFLACSMALRMAMGTSRALPMPKPAWPCWSPTTTRAEKLRFLPPLTTLVTRLMDTTWSFKALALASIGRRIESVSRNVCFDIRLEFQPRFPRGLGQRLHPAVVAISAAVENNLRNSLGAGAHRHRLAHDLGGSHVAPAGNLLAHLLVH